MGEPIVIPFRGEGIEELGQSYRRAMDGVVADTDRAAQSMQRMLAEATRANSDKLAAITGGGGARSQLAALGQFDYRKLVPVPEPPEPPKPNPEEEHGGKIPFRVQMRMQHMVPSMLGLHGGEIGRVAQSFEYLNYFAERANTTIPGMFAKFGPSIAIGTSGAALGMALEKIGEQGKKGFEEAGLHNTNFIENLAAGVGVIDTFRFKVDSLEVTMGRFQQATERRKLFTDEAHAGTADAVAEMRMKYQQKIAQQRMEKDIKDKTESRDRVTMGHELAEGGAMGVMKWGAFSAVGAVLGAAMNANKKREEITGDIQKADQKLLESAKTNEEQEEDLLLASTSAEKRAMGRVARTERQRVDAGGKGKRMSEEQIMDELIGGKGEDAEKMKRVQMMIGGLGKAEIDMLLKPTWVGGDEKVKQLVMDGKLNAAIKLSIELDRAKGMEQALHKIAMEEFTGVADIQAREARAMLNANPGMTTEQAEARVKRGEELAHRAQHRAAQGATGGLPSVDEQMKEWQEQTERGLKRRVTADEFADQFRLLSHRRAMLEDDAKLEDAHAAKKVNVEDELFAKWKTNHAIQKGETEQHYRARGEGETREQAERIEFAASQSLSGVERARSGWMSEMENARGGQGRLAGGAESLSDEGYRQRAEAVAGSEQIEIMNQQLATQMSQHETLREILLKMGNQPGGFGLNNVGNN